jgi:hypothetical protein
MDNLGISLVNLTRIRFAVIRIAGWLFWGILRVLKMRQRPFDAQIVRYLSGLRTEIVCGFIDGIKKKETKSPEHSTLR